MEEDLLNNDGPLIPTGEIGINKENSMVVINKKHKYNSEKKYGKNQDLSSKRLESMGFSKTRYDASGSNTNLGKNDTRIIYPSDMQPGESLPVVIMVPGDSQNSNFRNGYFNNYERVNGEDLPRAVYVVAGPHMKETMEDNAYKDVSEFLATKGVGISQIGVEAFSGGGGAGMIVAVCAADDNKDTPVLLLLTDAAKHPSNTSPGYSERKRYIESLSLYSKCRSHSNLNTVYLEGNEGRVSWDLSNKLGDRYTKITWNSSKYGIQSHAGANLDSQYYNVLLSFMGLTDTFVDLENGYRVNGMTKKQFVASLATVAYNAITLTEFLDDFNLHLGNMASERGSSVSGNDLIDIENSMASKLANNVADLSTVLSIDAANIAKAGKSFKDMDERLKRLLEDDSLMNLFDDFDVPQSLNIPKEKPIELNDPGTPVSTSKPSVKVNATGPGAGKVEKPFKLDLAPGVYLLGNNADGSSVVAQYDGNKITKLVYQYDYDNEDEAQTIKNRYDNSTISSNVKIFDNEHIVEVQIDPSIYANKEIEDIIKGLN